MSGMLRNSRKFTRDVSKKDQCRQKLNDDRKNARHGEFFFAEFLISSGETRKSPVFVLSSENNDNEDIVICSCTSSPARTEFDVYYKLKYDTYIRTNKIYTVHRDMLHFKIGEVDCTTDKYREIIQHVKFALDL